MIAPKVLLGRPRMLALSTLNLALLGLLLGWALAPPQTPAAAVRAPELVSPAPSDPTHAQTNIGDTYALLIGQPLFHQDRKYTPPPKIDLAVAALPPPDFALTGFLDIPGRPAKAFLRDRGGGRSLTVMQGDSVDGWQVVGLTPKQITLRHEDRTVVLNRAGPVAVSPGAATIAPLAGPASPQPSVPAEAAHPAGPTRAPSESLDTSHLIFGRPPETIGSRVSVDLPGVNVNATRIPGVPPIVSPLGPPFTYNPPPEAASN